MEIPAILMAATTTMVVTVMGGGYFVSNLPFWAVWIKYGSFITYSFNAVAIIDFTTAKIK